MPSFPRLRESALNHLIQINANSGVLRHLRQSSSLELDSAIVQIAVRLDNTTGDLSDELRIVIHVSDIAASCC